MTKDELIVLLNGIEKQIKEKIIKFNEKNYDFLFDENGKKYDIDFVIEPTSGIMLPIIHSEDNEVFSDFLSIAYNKKNISGYYEGVSNIEEPLEEINYTIVQEYNNKVSTFIFHYKKSEKEAYYECSQIEQSICFLKTNTTKTIFYNTKQEKEKFYKKFSKISKFLEQFLINSANLIYLSLTIYKKMEDEGLINDFDEYNETIKLLFKNDINN